ncbi:HBR238Wp [Eremothecium sinecaudum]|uniref:20S-pre-rRNA D-site endonuclease NOB1 n=1 Tax=Eremothecium sinecaudum TaxID=45286 RepID=A0A120K190_9SACH|nr:HBR238Wp [Eremothecium sinecaudum]AMD19139.1 HBR238Wp [Eremothecium sinecaudum]
MFSHHKAKAIVLDASPLITGDFSEYLNCTKSFYTTPSVYNEIKDEAARKKIEILGSYNFTVKQPAPEYIKIVREFAKLTGDSTVLSVNDIDILALTYQLEVECNDGRNLNWEPGTVPEKEKIAPAANAAKESKSEPASATGEGKKKNRRRGGKKQRAKREAQLAEEAGKEAVRDPPQGEVTEEVKTDSDLTAETEEQRPSESLQEDFGDRDDDGEWISPDNLTEAITKDNGEEGAKDIEAFAKALEDQVTIFTCDYAIQNVALEIGLHLLTPRVGMRIREVRKYMLRCHACFKMLPLPEDGKAKHFCPSCGSYSTLMRCTVSEDPLTGAITPHLKSKFQWNSRGNRYSLPSPLSKNSQKRFGKKGFVHTKHAQDVVILREDQKEYQQSVKQEDWTKRHNDKILNDWVAGGSADNCVSPFAITGLKHHTVKVGRGRHVNSPSKRK